MDANTPRPPRDDESWEIKAIADFAKAVERADPEELTAELCRQWLSFTRRRPGAPRSRGYLAAFLRNKLLNWRRNARRRQAHHVALDPWSEEEESYHEWALPAPVPPAESGQPGFPFEQFLETLPPKLRRLWDLRLKRKMTHVAEARLLHKHRNTIRVWSIRLQEALIAFAKSLAEPLPEVFTALRRATRRPRRPYRRDAFVPVPIRFLDALLRHRLSGMQWRIVLKVLLDTYRHKQGAVRFTWYAMARDLGVHHSGLLRAARDLSRRGLIAVADHRIGVHRLPLASAPGKIADRVRR